MTGIVGIRSVVVVVQVWRGAALHNDASRGNLDSSEKPVSNVELVRPDLLPLSERLPRHQETVRRKLGHDERSLRGPAVTRGVARRDSGTREHIRDRLPEVGPETCMSRSRAHHHCNDGKSK